MRFFAQELQSPFSGGIIPFMSSREERANTLVAEVLGKLLGMEVRAETSGRVDRRLLDIHIPKYNAVLEAKYDDFDAAVQAAQNRWANMDPPPEIVGALSYHSSFREDPKTAMRRDDSIQFALTGERHADMRALKRTGTVYDLAQALRRPAAILHPDRDEIEDAVGSIEGALAAFYDSVRDDRGVLYKFARILQANFEIGEEKKILEQSARVAGLILFGAFLFQFALARKDARVKTPSANSLSALKAHWEMILDDINYAAIFGVARRILEAGVLPSPVKALLDAADDTQMIAADGTDLMGRIYHRLLADAKPLGAFYTSIPAATLIAGLALSPKDWGDDSQWADLEFVRKFRIADPACGSGTLLAAACWQMRDNFARADFRERGVVLDEKKSPPDDMQKCLLEEIVWGYDILETAGHLTATTLGLMAPDVDFRRAHIYRTIIGSHAGGAAAGGLELLEGNLPIFRRDKQVETADKPEPLPELDLCIMNPPFVRGTKGSLTFGFLGNHERELTRARIKKLSCKHDFVFDGQGPAFVALACHKRVKTHFIRPGGRLAMILPATFAVGMGDAWRKSREKIEQHFDLEALIVSWDLSRLNFSENTNLQECIVIARKRAPRTAPKKNALFVALHKNPDTVDAALSVARSVARERERGETIGVIGEDAPSRAGDGVVGELARLPYFGRSAWRGISFSNMHLSLAAETLMRTKQLKPFVPRGRIPLRALEDMATLGSGRLDKYINDTTRSARRAVLSRTLTAYPGYFPGQHKRNTGVSQKDLQNIAEHPQCYCLPLPGREDWADKYWSEAGRIVLAESFRFNTMRRLAVLISQPVQASHYWPIALKKEGVRRRKALVLWLNSTPAIFLTAHFSQSTHGAKIGFSQAAAEEMPVLDLDELDGKQLRKLAAVFDEIAAGDGFLPIPHLTHDPARIKVDAAISEVCGIGDLAPLRAALAVEPIITNKPAGVAAD